MVLQSQRQLHATANLPLGLGARLLSRGMLRACGRGPKDDSVEVLRGLGLCV